MRIHVGRPGGEEILKEAERLVKTRQKEIADAWNNNFGG